MEFFRHEQHSLEQLGFLQAMLVDKARNSRDDFFLASELIKHAHPSAGPFIRTLKSRTSHPQALAFISRLEGMLHEIDKIQNLRFVLGDRELTERLYQKHGFQLALGDANSSSLVIVFTTMYNNFSVSNPVFYAMLRQLGVSVLLLKDTSLFNYLRGIDGLGESLGEVAGNVGKLIKDNHFDKVYVLGFSSSSYASLYFSYLIRCNKYLGFSVISDLSAGSPCPAPKYFTADVRGQVNPRDLIDLRAYAKDRYDGVKRTVYFGADSATDVRHAKNLVDLRDYAINECPNCGHATVDHLLSKGRLYRVIRQLVLDP